MSKKPDFEQLLPRFDSLPPGSLGKKQSTEKSVGVVPCAYP